MIELARETETERTTDGPEFSPLVAIVMPVFNAERTLAVAIRSILNQTYGNWELLLMDDGSSDRSLEIARSFSDPRILVFADHLHKGRSRILNHAVALGRGEYFARMDADDVAYPERIARQVEFLNRHPEIDLLGCAMLVFKGNGVALGSRPVPQTHEEICRRPSRGFPIGHPTWMGRASWFRAHPYDAKAVRAEDQVLLLRNYSASRFACLPEILCGYREERLVLGKILRGRYEFAKAVFEKYVELGRYFSLFSAILCQLSKAFLDILSIATGLGYLVLAHRARSLGPESLQRWPEVWSQVNAPASLELPAGGLLDF